MIKLGKPRHFNTWPMGKWSQDTPEPVIAFHLISVVPFRPGQFMLSFNMPKYSNAIINASSNHHCKAFFCHKIPRVKIQLLILNREIKPKDSKLLCKLRCRVWVTRHREFDIDECGGFITYYF